MKGRTGTGKTTSNQQQLALFAIAEIKSQIPAEGIEVEKVEAYNKAWRLGVESNDFSLVDKIYYPDFKAIDAVPAVEVNIDAFKEALHTLKDSILVTPAEVIVENDNFLKAHRYNRYTEADIFNSVTVSLFYKDGKIINQETVFEELDYDPSEGQDWNWEDYE